MLLQHAVKFHEARDWIWLQDQSQLTYKSLLQHCKTLEQHCEQYQKAQIKSHAEQPSLQQQLHHSQFTRMLSPHTTSSAPSEDTNTLETNALQLAKNATTAMEQNTTQHSAGAQDKQEMIILGPTAGPTIETPTTTDTTANLPAGTDSSAKGTPVTHIDHLTLQEGIRRSPTPRSHKVSHITSTIHSRPEDRLATDVASDGYTSFHTIVQMIPSKAAIQSQLRLTLAWM